MKQITAVMGKELAVIFASPIFYAAGFIFLLVAGYFFYTDVAYYNILSLQAAGNPLVMECLNPADMVIRPFFGNVGVILLLMLPLLTMRLYSEERKTGTIELLFTYPVSDFAVLSGKFSATVIVLLVLLAGTFPCFILLRMLCTVDWGLVVSGYTGLLLMGGAFIAIGSFTSSLTENQIVSAVLCFGALLLFWALGWGQTLVGGTAGAVLNHLAVISHFDPFASGLMDSRDGLYYVFFIFFWLFLTLRLLGSRYWRG